MTCNSKPAWLSGSLLLGVGGGDGGVIGWGQMHDYSLKGIAYICRRTLSDTWECFQQSRS